MTPIDAMKQALEALETVFMPHHPAVIALRLAIEQAERQEPVAFFDPVAHRLRQNPAFQVGVSVATWHGEIPLYTAPPQRQPLTDEEIISHFKHEVDTGSLLSFADGVRFAERKHGITGEK